jgi:hypothetical protein
MKNMKFFLSCRNSWFIESSLELRDWSFVHSCHDFWSFNWKKISSFLERKMIQIFENDWLAVILCGFINHRLSLIPQKNVSFVKHNFCNYSTDTFSLSYEKEILDNDIRLQLFLTVLCHILAPETLLSRSKRKTWD